MVRESLPAGHRGRRELTERLLAQVRAIAGGEAFVGRFATAAAATLYRRAGFDDKTQMRGMWQIVRTA